MHDGAEDCEISQASGEDVERRRRRGGAYLITYYGDRDILDALYRRLQSESSRGTAKIGSILSTRR